jgi:ATP-dependent DNA helicase RecG
VLTPDGRLDAWGKSGKHLAAELDLETIGDLLHYYPRRYARRGELTDLAALQVGEHVTVVGQVVSISTSGMRNRSGTITRVVIGDGRGSLLLTFFDQAWRERQLVPGTRGLFSGKVSEFRGDRQLTHPDYQLFNDPELAARAYAGALIPVYPATAKVPSWTIAKTIGVLLDSVGELPDPLPPAIRQARGLLDYRPALEGIHRPPDDDVRRAAQERLKWDEAMVLQVALAQRRYGAAATSATPRPRRPAGLLAAFDATLPFALTAGQREVGEQIFADLALDRPMQRLLQGEVGSGKTVVALRAMLAAVDTGGQAVLLAPTEVLALQHVRTLRALLGPLATAGELGAPDPATRIALLTGSLGAAARRDALAEVADGRAGLVVGTHAVLEGSVQFHDLALLVVDEQHRFGVEQRDALRTRAPAGAAPHLLVMTATPIPRTVAMTVFGDLETSVLTELPAGRGGVDTHVVPAANAAWTTRMWDRLREEVAAGRQAFVVCPRIGEGLDEGPDAEGSRTAAVLEVAPRLAGGDLAGTRLEALHGRLAPDEKDRVMTAFARGELDVLVATTVVEVGVDVPNATAMVVLDADRFGVSQLHQLRGRVARGSARGVCLLQTALPEGSPPVTRLHDVAATTDGARLAELDLRARGEGTVLGTRQAGRSALRLLSLLDDEQLIVAARHEAIALVAADPDLLGWPALAERVAAGLAPRDAAFLDKV